MPENPTDWKVGDLIRVVESGYTDLYPGRTGKVTETIGDPEDYDFILTVEWDDQDEVDEVSAWDLIDIQIEHYNPDPQLEFEL